jgi:GNAT superfamily N-acetyltransferase
MSKIGNLNSTLSFDGLAYPAERLAETAQRLGFQSVFAVGGMPASLTYPLARAAQVCDVPHTWRVKEAQSEAEVDDATLARGREILLEDKELRGADIICYIGSKEFDLSEFDLADAQQAKNWDFLGAGAIRNKLNSTYFNPSVPVVSRAIVAPRFRGLGIGSVLVEHRLSLLLNGYFGSVPKAIHFGTESAKILTSVRRIERQEGVHFVHIGDEQLTTDDGTHTVHDYLCFLPWYQQEIHKALAELKVSLSMYEQTNAIENLDSLWRLFMQEGVTAASGKALLEAFQMLCSVAPSNDALADVSSYFEEFLEFRREIGAEDPIALT